MAEFAPHHEKLHMPETAGDDHERPVNRVERRAETIGAATKSLEAIRHDIAEQARSKREVQVNKPEQQTTVYPTFVNRSLKLIARRRLLKQIRRHLAPPDRAFSHIIHQPIIDQTSELAAKTVARPSGLLSGGLFALIGSGALLYIDKHYGYRYNFLVWMLCFAGGFVLGLVLEAIISFSKRLRS